MSIVKVFNNYFKNKRCWKCKQPFVNGEEVVSTGVTHHYASQRHTYHKYCYTDAHGVPIHE